MKHFLIILYFLIINSTCWLINLTKALSPSDCDIDHLISNVIINHVDYINSLAMTLIIISEQNLHVIMPLDYDSLILILSIHYLTNISILLFPLFLSLNVNFLPIYSPSFLIFPDSPSLIILLPTISITFSCFYLDFPSLIHPLIFTFVIFRLLILL
jgi:hypothetical protein